MFVCTFIAIPIRVLYAIKITINYTGADPGFQVRGGGAHLKKLRRAEGVAKILGVFRVKNHIFSNFKVPPLGSAPAILILTQSMLRY